MSIQKMLLEGELNITIDIDCMCDISECTEPVIRVYVFENREVWQVCQKHSSEFYKVFMQEPRPTPVAADGAWGCPDCGCEWPAHRLSCPCGMPRPPRR
jgi:hypothetical protein